MLILDAGGCIRDYNPSAIRMMGSERGAINQRNLGDFFGERFARAFPEKLKLLEELGHIVIEAHLGGARDSGTAVLLDLSQVPLEDGGMGILAVVRELGSREQLEHDLELQRQIIEARWAENPTTGSATRLLILFSSDGHKERYPAPPVGKAGKGATLLQEVLPLFEEDYFKQTLEKAWLGEWVALSNGWYGRTPSALGAPAMAGHYLRVELAPLRGASGEVTRVMALVEDLTAQRLRQEQDRRMDQRALLGLFAGALNHEFNNYLGVILAQAAALRLATPPGKIVPPSVGAIMDAAQKAAGLLRRTTEAGQNVTETWGSLDLNRPVAEAAYILLHDLNANVNLHLELGDRVPEVNGDPALLRAMVVALGRRALALMPAGGELTIATARAERNSPVASAGAVLTLRDTGLGMDALTRAQIMDSLVPVEAAGDMLDLAVARAVVLQHRGRFEVDSAPGRGTTFRVVLPGQEKRPHLTGHQPGPGATLDEASMERQLSRAAQVALPASSQKFLNAFESGARVVVTPRPKILLADDEENFRDFVREVLVQTGYQVVSAANGQEAFEQFQERPESFALAILDAYMPRLGGLETYLRMQALRPDLPVIFVSGFVRGPSRDALLAACPGRAHVLLKPFTAEQVAAEVGKMMELVWSQ